MKIDNLNKIVFCFFLIILCSCNEKHPQFENQSYEIVSILYDTLGDRLPIPPMPPSSGNLSKEDSLKNIEKIIKFTKLEIAFSKLLQLKSIFFLKL